MYENSLVRLSTPGKMPWYSYNIPAEHCKRGAELSEIEGSVCGDCYAKKRRYNFPVVKNAVDRNWKQYNKEVSNLSFHIWLWASIEQKFTNAKNVNRVNKHFFRLFDQGDIQSVQHLRQLTWVAKELPKIRFWCPTHEPFIVEEFVKEGHVIPKNFKIRISDDFPDQEISEHQELIDKLNECENVECKIGTSGVTTNIVNSNCIAHTQGNKCFGVNKKCADCWLSVVDRVMYPKI